MFKFLVPLVLVVIASSVDYFVGKYISKKYALIGIVLFVVLQALHMFLRYHGIAFDALSIGKAWLLSTGIILVVFYAIISCVNRKKEIFNPSRRAALFAMGAMLPSTYGVAQGVRVPDVVYHDFYSEKIQKLHGFKIFQVTDMHISGLFGKSWCAELVQKINAAKPDIVVFTGDLSDGFLDERYDDLSPLNDVQAPMYACLGNHEYIYDFIGFQKRFTELGMKILANEHTVISVKGEKLVLAGITDKAAERRGFEKPNIEKALKNANTEHLTIMLNHRPSLTKELATRGVDLQLSGHTHGGQFIGLNGIVKLFNEGFLYGWYNIGTMKLYVSSGAALWAGAPFRLGMPSELPIITLKNPHVSS